MITTRHMHAEVEMIRWLLLTVAAAAFVLAVATALAAADPMQEPRLLPDDMGVLAKPITPTPIKPYFPEDPPVRHLPPAEAAARLSMILDSHRAGCAAEALAGWAQIRLPAETAHWRKIAIGAACLHTGDLERASVHLEAARQMEPDNPLVAYFTGVLRLEQAAAVGRVPDGMQRRNQLLVAYTPEDKTLYEMLAISELRQAIALASEIQLDQRLLLNDPQVEEAIDLPRVGDLLVALGADNYVGKAHHVLFGLYLDQAELAHAEFHLNRAVETGIAPLYGYQDLAAAYLDQGRNADTLRVAAKDLQAKHPWIRPLCERLTALASDTAKAVWVW